LASGTGRSEAVVQGVTVANAHFCEGILVTKPRTSRLWKTGYGSNTGLQVPTSRWLSLHSAMGEAWSGRSVSCHNFCVLNTTEWSAGPLSLTAPFAGSDFLYEGAKSL